MTNRDTEAARRYHESTNHSAASVRADLHRLEFEIMPRPFKVYPDLAPIPLPRDFDSSGTSALAAVADSGGMAGDVPDLTLSLLAHLLYFSAGVLRRRQYPGGEAFFRAAACTGNLHHIDLYLVAGTLADLEAGVYHFSPHDFALRLLRKGDHRGALVEATSEEPRVAEAPVVVVFGSTWWRNSWKYQARTYRHCFWDSGTLLANLLSVAAARGVPAEVVLGFVDDRLNRLLGVDTEREVTLGLVALGRGTPAPAAAAVPQLDAATLPLSSREVDYPAIREIHAASSLATPGEVVEWRRALPAWTSPAPGGPLIPLPPERTAPPEPVEAVILRRGSARAFSHASIGFDQLSTILSSATAGVPADFLAPGAQRSEPYLVVNAVDDLAPGAYFFDRERAGLVVLGEGELRREAGWLGLGQEIPADAAVDIFWLTALDPILEALGNRGYRAAQLEAAIGGGKTYLAAYALGLGASGLTFFDDDVIRFFSPHAAGKSVMFLMAVGIAGRPSAG